MTDIIRDENEKIISIKGYSVNDKVHYTEGSGDAEKLKTGVIKKIVEGPVLVKVYIDAATDEDVIFSWQIVPVEILKQKEDEKKVRAKAKAEAKEKRIANLAKAKTAKAEQVRLDFMSGELELPARASIAFINKVIPNGYKIEKQEKAVYNVSYMGDTVCLHYTAPLGKMILDIRKQGFEKFIKKNRD